MQVSKKAVRAAEMNAVMERFLWNVGAEALDDGLVGSPVLGGIHHDYRRAA